MEWFKIMRIVMMVIMWFDTANSDGKITRDEIKQIASMAVMETGFPIQPRHIECLFELVSIFRGHDFKITG